MYNFVQVNLSARHSRDFSKNIQQFVQAIPKQILSNLFKSLMQDICREFHNNKIDFQGIYCSSN